SRWRGSPTEQDHGPVRRIPGVVLKVGAEGQLLPVPSVQINRVDVALNRLAEHLLAIARPLRSTARFSGGKACVFLAVQAQDENIDVPQMPAGDGEVLAVGGERGHSASLPFLGRDTPLITGIKDPDERLVVADEDDRLVVGRPGSLGALREELWL